MSKIIQLKNEIAEIEAQAHTLGTDKVALYDLLVVAYFKQKDLITLVEETRPVPEKIIDTDKIDELTYTITELRGKLAIEEAAKDLSLEQLKSIAAIACPPQP